MSHRRRRTVVAATVLLALAALAAPVLAHPFGPPPTALVSARGHTVTIEWRSAPDDAIAVGVEVGLMDEALVDAYLEGPAQAAPPERVELDLSASDELHDYLTEHIVVEQDGDRCDPRVEPIGNFVHEGARTVHECPEPVTEVSVTITMLHARHPAYRTFGISGREGANPQQAVFSRDSPEHAWDFTAEEGGGDPAAGGATWWPLALVGLIAAGGVTALVLRGGEPQR